MKKIGDKFFYEKELTLRELFSIMYKNKKDKYEGVRIEQMNFYCYVKVENKYILMLIKLVRDFTSLKLRMIEDVVQNEKSKEKLFTMDRIGMFNDNEPTEERWGYVDDYELMEMSNDIPIIKKIR